MKLTYGVNDKPKFGQVIVFALQQLLAILAATICVPAQAGIPGGESAALLGAGIGTIVYLLFTKFRSPVFLGSSFAFINSMTVAWSGAIVGTASAQKGYAGLIVGAAFAGLVYVVIAIVVRFCGTKWIDKVMPPVVIGPTVSIIGLGLAATAVTECFSWASAEKVGNSFFYNMTTNAWVSLICALIALFAVILVSVYGKKIAKLIPYVIGIGAGYIAATIFTVIGRQTGNADLILINFDAFKTFDWIPNIAFIEGAKGFSQIDGKYIATLAVAYAPVAFVVFAEHLADHKNLSSIIEKDLLEDPGLHRTLLGDGVGSMAGAIFGGCPNTTYGESIGCTAITGNASIITIFVTAILAIVASFIAPFTTFLGSIPACVMGGVCFTLYGFIAVSGLKMLQPVDLNDNGNLFTASVILVGGIGGLAMTIGELHITAVACALILGIITNLICKAKKKTDEE